MKAKDATNVISGIVRYGNEKFNQKKISEEYLNLIQPLCDFCVHQ